MNTGPLCYYLLQPYREWEDLKGQTLNDLVVSLVSFTTYRLQSYYSRCVLDSGPRSILVVSTIPSTSF